MWGPSRLWPLCWELVFQDLCGPLFLLFSSQLRCHLLRGPLCGHLLSLGPYPTSLGYHSMLVAPHYHPTSFSLVSLHLFISFIAALLAPWMSTWASWTFLRLNEQTSEVAVAGTFVQGEAKVVAGVVQDVERGEGICRVGPVIPRQALCFRESCCQWRQLWRAWPLASTSSLQVAAFIHMALMTHFPVFQMEVKIIFV